VSRGLGRVERAVLEHVELTGRTPMHWLAYHAYQDPSRLYVPADSPSPWPTEAQFHAVRRAVRSLERKGYLRVDRARRVKVERQDGPTTSYYQRRYRAVVRVNRRGHPKHPDCRL